MNLRKTTIFFAPTYAHLFLHFVSNTCFNWMRLKEFFQFKLCVESTFFLNWTNSKYSGKVSIIFTVIQIPAIFKKLTHVCLCARHEENNLFGSLRHWWHESNTYIETQTVIYLNLYARVSCTASVFAYLYHLDTISMRNTENTHQTSNE